MAQSEEHTNENGIETITNTFMPHAEAHAPLSAKDESDLAQEIRSVDLPATLRQALKKKKGKGSVFVNINLNGQTVTKSSASAYSSQMGDVLEWLKKCRTRATESAKTTVDWIKNNKKKFALCCLGGTYCALQTYLWYLSHSLTQDTCWSRWKNQCSLEDLYKYKQSELVQDILQEVRKRSPNIGDDTATLAQFLQEVDKELRMFGSYRMMVTIVDKLYLRAIFFYNSALYQEVADRCNRLLFIKNSALATVADLKKSSFSPPQK